MEYLHIVLPVLATVTRLAARVFTWKVLLVILLIAALARWVSYFDDNRETKTEIVSASLRNFDKAQDIHVRRMVISDFEKKGLKFASDGRLLEDGETTEADTTIWRVVVADIDWVIPLDEIDKEVDGEILKVRIKRVIPKVVKDETLSFNWKDERGKADIGIVSSKADEVMLNRIEVWARLKATEDELVEDIRSIFLSLYHPLGIKEVQVAIQAEKH